MSHFRHQTLFDKFLVREWIPDFCRKPHYKFVTSILNMNAIFLLYKHMFVSECISSVSVPDLLFLRVSSPERCQLTFKNRKD